MKIICVGRNYAAHIEELSSERPKEPVLFLKPDSSVILKNNPFIIPEFSKEVHYEVEVLVKIKKIGKYINQQFAHKYYDEIGLGIDFTARDLQQELKEKGLPWEKAKAFDGAALIGNFLPKSELKDVDDLHFELRQNGEVKQKGHTAFMLWKIDALIEYISKYFTLKIGDVIFTGTPAGVGKVHPNDVLEGSLEHQELFTIKVK